MATQVQDAKAGVNALVERLGTPEAAQMTFTAGAELADVVDGHCPVLDFTGNQVPVERTLL